MKVVDLFPKKNATSDIPMTSNHKIDDVALFEPNIDNIDPETMQPICQAGPTPVKIVGIKFVAGKVLYDVVVPYSGSETGWYDARPIRDVDSYLVLKG